MKLGRGFMTMAVAAAASLALLGAACNSGAAAEDTPNGSTGNTSPNLGAPAPSGSVSQSERMDAAYSGYGYTSYPVYDNGASVGITVTGAGSVTLSPDLAILSMGVEAREETVEAARSRAAEAMDAVVRALDGFDIRDNDVQTRYFNIQPEYRYQEVYDSATGVRRGESVLVGYRVTNSIEVKVRDLDRAGEVIDAVAEAGGETVRINNISFTVEDPVQYESQARELAVKEARAKAEQMATWAGETLGKLIYLREASAPSPVRMDMAIAEAAPAQDGGRVATPINPGELEVRVTVQAAWGVQ